MKNIKLDPADKAFSRYIRKRDKLCPRCNLKSIFSSRSKYCIDCRHKSKRKLADKKCQGCGKLFRPKDSLKKFCSAKCSYENRPKKGKVLECSICNTKFYRTKSQHENFNKTYCSRRCAHKGALKNTPLKCKICNKEYYLPVSQVRWRGSAYCSIKCRSLGQKEAYKKTRFDRYKYPKTLVKFKKWVWKIFSDYIRRRDNWTCFTCGRYAVGKSMHAGHFIPRTYSATLFDEINVNAQCYSCNIWKRGNAGEYSIRLIQKYGNEKIENLIIKSRQTHKFSYEELEKLYEHYKELLKTL